MVAKAPRQSGGNNLGFEAKETVGRKEIDHLPL